MITYAIKYINIVQELNYSIWTGSKFTFIFSKPYIIVKNKSMIIVGRVRSALYFLPAFQKALYYSYTITYYYYTYIYYIPGLYLILLDILTLCLYSMLPEIWLLSYPLLPEYIILCSGIVYLLLYPYLLPFSFGCFGISYLDYYIFSFFVCWYCYV